MPSFVVSYVLPLQSNYCKHFGAHPARLFPQNTFIFTYMVAFFFFFFPKLRSHKASSPGTCWLPFFHERICHKLSICSCLSGGTWMESLVFLMSPWVVSGPFNFFVEWDVSWEKSSVLLTVSREGNATIPWKLFLVLYSLSHQKNLPDVDPVFFLVTEDPPCFLFSLHAY